MLNGAKKITASILALSIATQAFAGRTEKLSPTSDIELPLLAHSHGSSGSPDHLHVRFLDPLDSSLDWSSSTRSSSMSDTHISSSADTSFGTDEDAGIDDAVKINIADSKSTEFPEELRKVLKELSTMRLGQKSKYSRAQKIAAAATIAALAYALRGEGNLAAIQTLAWVSDDQMNSMSDDDFNTLREMSGAAFGNAIGWLSPYACLMLGKFGAELAKDPTASIKEFKAWTHYYAASIARKFGIQGEDPDTLRPQSIYKENRLWLRRLLALGLTGASAGQAAIPAYTLYDNCISQPETNNANYLSQVPFLFFFEVLKNYEGLSPLNDMLFNRFSRGETTAIVSMRLALLNRFTGAKDRIFRMDQVAVNQTFAKFHAHSQKPTILNTEERLLAETWAKMQDLVEQGKGFVAPPTAKRTWAARILGAATTAVNLPASALITFYSMAMGSQSIGITNSSAQLGVGVVGSIPGIPLATLGTGLSNVKYFSTLFDLFSKNPVEPHAFSSNPKTRQGIFASSTLEGMALAAPNFVAVYVKLMEMQMQGMISLDYGSLLALSIPYWFAHGLQNAMLFYNRYAHLPHAITDAGNSAIKGVRQCLGKERDLSEDSWLRKKDLMVQASQNTFEMVAKLDDPYVVSLFKQLELEDLEVAQEPTKDVKIDVASATEEIDQSQPGRVKRILNKLAFWRR